MKRRKFVTDLLITGGVLGTGIGCGRRIEPETSEKPVTENMEVTSENSIMEPAREIPVLAKTDVLVIGGGPAGTAAAIAASKTGAETWLVERYNHLGGLWTGGLVLPLLATHAINKQKKWDQVLFGIGGEMAKRLVDIDMSISRADCNYVIEPEAGKYVLEEMVREAGVKMLYHAWGVNAIMDGNTIKGVIIESKSGRTALLAKVVIDCTGDGDVFHWAGEDYDKMNYTIGINHRLGNIDKINPEAPGFVKLRIGKATPIPGVNYVGAWGVEDQDSLDVKTLSELQMKFRKEIWEGVQKIKQTPGYEDVFLMEIAPQIGVRMSRILEGEFKLSLEDTLTYRTFDDAIGVSGSWTSVLFQGKKYSMWERPLWQIPYRSLLPKKTENLLVAGRCICSERDLVEDTRIITACLVTGQGAGAAAGLAVKDNVMARNIDREKLKKMLLEQGVFFG